MNYVGDFVDDATVYIPFNTFDSNDPSASVTITDLVASDVEVWKDGVVQTTPGAGVTVTLNIGANNGSHLIAVDTSDVTDAGWFATGSDYQVRINGTTVDAATINAWVGSFSIQNRFMRGTDSAALATVLGAAVGASISADIADLPTVAEFEARTIVSADYTIVADLGVVQSADNDTKLTAIETDTGTTLPARFTGIEGATFDTATDSLEVIRNDRTLAAADYTIVADLGVVQSADNDTKISTIVTATITNAQGADVATDVAAIAGTDGLALISTDAQDLSATLDVNTKTLTAGVIDAAAIATDAIDADALASDAVDEIWAKAMSDLAGIPAANASVLEAINIVFMALRNKQTSAANSATIANDAGATIATAALSDAAGTFTKGEYA